MKNALVCQKAPVGLKQHQAAKNIQARSLAIVQL